VKLALHTNTPHSLAKYQLEKFNLDEEYFDLILALDMEDYDQFNAKPEPWGVDYIQKWYKKKKMRLMKP